MTDKVARRPVANFFLKKSMQLAIVGKIVFVVLLSALLTTLLLSILYNAKSQAGSFYYMSNNVMEDLKLQSILGLVLPALVAAQTAGVLVALGIGLFSSRIVAVPLYKIEKWAAQLKEGNFNTRLAFRETKEMQDVTDRCNAVTEAFKDILSRVDESVKVIEQVPSQESSVKGEAVKMRRLLDTLQFAEEQPSVEENDHDSPA
jgi:methyl-accepting chemotaxis protein